MPTPRRPHPSPSPLRETWHLGEENTLSHKAVCASDFGRTIPLIMSINLLHKHFFLLFFTICLLRTPPFSSDEESKDEETDEEEDPQKHQRAKSPIAKIAKHNQPTPAQIRTSKNTPVLARQAAVKQSSSTSPQRDRVLVGGPTKLVMAKMQSEEEEDDDWSDVSELQEIDLRQLQSNKDQNSNVDKKSFGKGTLIFLQTASSAHAFK